MESAFWRNKRVFVTGHSGFKGSWLSLWLHRLGATTTGYSLAPVTTPNLFETARLAAVVPTTIADIRDGARLEHAMRTSGAEVVFHLAAQALVRQSYRDPVETFSTNVLGTAHVLQAARATPSVRAVVVVTSDKCYLDRDGAPYVETDALGGAGDPYSASKAGAEFVVAGYRAMPTSPAAVATARAGNVFGGGDWAEDRLVPDAIRAFSSGSELLVRNPTHVRPWQHVLEPLQGYLALAQLLWESPHDAAGAFNFGADTSDDRTVAQVADVLARSWGDGARWKASPETQAQPEAAALRLNSGKAHERLSWRPRMSMSAALERTVRWYRKFAAGADARELTFDDISAYESSG